MLYSKGKIDFKFTRTAEIEKCKMYSEHVHPHHELYFLVSGSVNYFIDGRIFALRQGDFIFIPQGKFHQTTYPDGITMEKIMLEFDDEFLGEGYEEYIKRLSDIIHFRIQAKYRHITDGILYSLETENRKQRSDFREMQRLYLCQLIISFLRFLEEPSSVKLNETYKTIEDAAAFIKENYASELSLSNIAERYSVSPEYFSKIFKTVTGVGFSEYLNITRINAAEKLLAETDRSATEIAAECGFNSVSYFIQLFKLRSGITPKQYSLRHKK